MIYNQPFSQKKKERDEPPMSQKKMSGLNYGLALPMNVATWNIAGINNNPFEYWTTFENEDTNKKYQSLMKAIKTFMETEKSKAETVEKKTKGLVEEVVPNFGGASIAARNRFHVNAQRVVVTKGSLSTILESSREVEILVGDVFTLDMAEELFNLMRDHKVKGWEEVKEIYDKDYCQRPIIKKFLLDEDIAKKRFVSGPDRYTNTILNSDSTKAMRPSAINAYEGDLSEMSGWWEQWKAFMFSADKKVGSKSPYKLIKKLTHDKYKAIDEIKEAPITIPLQIMACAIFDAILIFMLNEVSNDWQELRKKLVAVNEKKQQNTYDILNHYEGNQFLANQVIFLQEVSANFFTEEYKEKSGFKFHESSGAQQSVILTQMLDFQEQNITRNFLEHCGMRGDIGKKVKANDICVVTAQYAEDEHMDKYILISYHAESSGKDSEDILRLIKSVKDQYYDGFIMVLGMDANTKKNDTLASFIETVNVLGLEYAKASNSSVTTCKARTYLQPQFSKAVYLDDPTDKKNFEENKNIDHNLKDFCIYESGKLQSSDTKIDNTGKKRYTSQFLPTSTFPSDHAVVSTTLSMTKERKEKYINNTEKERERKLEVYRAEMAASRSRIQAERLARKADVEKMQREKQKEQKQKQQKKQIRGNTMRLAKAKEKACKQDEKNKENNKELQDRLDNLNSGGPVKHVVSGLYRMNSAVGLVMVEMLKIDRF